MNNKVTSQALSKRLYEKGVRVESEFVWGYQYESDEPIYNLYLKDIKFLQKKYPALLSSEIGELLPEYIPNENMGGGFVDTLHIEKFDVDNEWIITYGNTVLKRHKNEAEARGLMLEYLIDNELIKL